MGQIFDRLSRARFTQKNAEKLIVQNIRTQMPTFVYGEAMIYPPERSTMIFCFFPCQMGPI
jgi:hypothetical protein